jgi:phage gp36-like protein
MKTLAAFNKPIDAHLLIARLQGSGIAAYARDEYMVTIDWLASNAVGGVKVDVADEDYDRAVEVMSTCPATEPDDPSFA